MRRNSLSALRRPDQLYRRLDELSAFAADRAQLEERVFWFVQLVRWLRGSRSEKRGLRLRYLRVQLEQHPEWRATFSASLTQLVSHWDCAQLLAYGGVPRDFHLAGAVGEWLAFRGLPVACNTTDPVQVLALAFREDDDAWMSAGEIGLLARELIDAEARPALDNALDEALVDLSNQLVAQAHSPAVRNLARVERSPFGGLNSAVAEFLASSRSERRPDALVGRVRQCLQADVHQHEVRRERRCASDGFLSGVEPADLVTHLHQLELEVSSRDRLVFYHHDSRDDYRLHLERTS